jgi:hypothetical protein
MPNERQRVDNGDLPIIAGRLHAPPNHPHGHQNELKQDQTGDNQYKNPHQRPFGAGTKQQAQTKRLELMFHIWFLARERSGHFFVIFSPRQ